MPALQRADDMTDLTVPLTGMAGPGQYGCWGWVVSDLASRSTARKCSKGPTLSVPGTGRAFCEVHDPRTLKRRVRKLFREGRPGAARLLMRLEGLALEEVLTPVTVHDAIVTARMVEDLEAAVRCYEQAHPELATSIDGRRQRARLQQALAALRENVGLQPGVELRRLERRQRGMRDDEDTGAHTGEHTTGGGTGT